MSPDIVDSTLGRRASESTAQALLRVVDRFSEQFRVGRRVTATLDSSLERDLGLDSLARVELLARIERAFSVRLPEDTLVNAETPGDILQALQAARKATPAAGLAEVPYPALEEVTGLPDQAATLADVLDWHVREHADRAHILFYRTAEQTEELTYRQLKHGAQAIAAGLRAGGLLPGQAVAIMLPTSLDFFYSFYGVVLAAGVPVPIYPPTRMTQIGDHLRRQSNILASCLAPILITIPEAKLLGQLIKGLVDSLKSIVTVKELWVPQGESLRPALTPGDTALLQYTSGSTGNPKGVVLSHTNLLANIRAWGSTVAIGSTDVCVSWLPLYHDMGLIGAWLGSLYHACFLVLMSPFDFLTRPERWLWTIHRHKGTLTAAPNFAFELCLRRLEDRDLRGLDLSSCRLAANGAEPVSPDTVARFCERFGPYGFRSQAMTPVYGLAECAVGLAVPPLGRGPLVDRIQREPFMRLGRALPASQEDPHALRFVSCGSALPGHAMRVVDERGREVPEGTVGRLEFRGPSATSGYFRNPEQTRRLFHGDWLDTGDLAYMANAEVYLTSRAKDMIIRGGHNIYPYELEEAIGNLAGVRKGCVAIFGVADPITATERLVVVAETREKEGKPLDDLRRKINAVAVDLLGTPPDDVVLAPPHSVLKTSSGKIRRSATRELYRTGALGTTQRRAWWQLARLTFAGARTRFHRGARTMLELLYGLYAWALFCLFAPLTWLGVVLARSPASGWLITRLAARCFLRLIGTRLDVEGFDNLPPDSPYIVVANHASYLDGLVLIAALVRPVSFVAKREFKKYLVTRLFLEGIGAEFVERFETQRSVDDTRKLAAIVERGRSLFFFAEGTFARAPGLAPFHMGAFLIAAQANLPVIPVALRGTRFVLPDHSWIPRCGPVAVHIDTPIKPSGTDWDAAVALRNVARAEILRHCGEPDLID